MLMLRVYCLPVVEPNRKGKVKHKQLHSVMRDLFSRDALRFPRA
jgi:hypothetical protein